MEDENEKFGISKWCVLKKIKELSSYHTDGRIEYRYYSPPNLTYEDFPFAIMEGHILGLLFEEGVLGGKSDVGVENDSSDGSYVIPEAKSPVIPELGKLGTAKRIIFVQDATIIPAKFYPMYQEYKLKYANKTNWLVRQLHLTYDSRKRKLLGSIIKQKRLRGHEKELLELLKNFEPLDTERIKDKKTGIKDYKHLKSRVDKKLNGTGFKIKTIKGRGLKPSYYQLIYSPNEN